MTERRRIAVNTGGGDAPGLNAVIRAVVRSAERLGWEIHGILDSYDGLFEKDGVIPLDRRAVRGITHQGGTILGTTNRGNPLRWPVRSDDGSVRYEDRSQDVVDAIHAHGIESLIAIGGDGSLEIARHLSAKGLDVVGVPKTIDNDLAATNRTFGFMTAVETATEAIGKLHSTAEAHERVMVVELMGRHAGWISLFAGVAGTADVILIPEIPYSMDSVCEKIEERWASGREFAIVVVAEGAFPVGGEPLFKKTDGDGKKLGGMGRVVAEEIGERTGRETRELVLGHLQRGGSPNAYDRLLALRFGCAAVNLVRERRFGTMVALDPPEVRAVPLAEAVAHRKTVPLDSDVVQTARALGTCLGD
ncbi:MAG: ATP-dependent 6-phosphofructokinase [Longimicrobiales bacterium]|nr:ATP-dependent 6-phosphofructokinase [Longimicrobiales bacterium]